MECKSKKRKRKESCGTRRDKKALLKEKEKFRTQKETESENDEITHQILQEKKRSLEILDCILNASNPAPINENETIIDEAKTGLAESENEVVEEAGMDCTETSDKADRFYTVSADLKELFNSASNSDKGFSFLTEDDVGSKLDEDGNTEEMEETADKLLRTIQEKLPEMDDDRTTDKPKHPKYFFFHSSNRALRNRVDENTFYRLVPLEELEKEWPSRRTVMKQSFRRRHKEALRVSKRRRKPWMTAA